MHPIIPQATEKRLGDVTLICIELTENLVSQCVNDRLVAVVNICACEHKVDQLTLLIAEQMQFESDVPSHGALPFLRKPFEHLHAELALVVNDRNTCAVHKTDPGAFPETGKFQEHGQCHKTAGHDLNKTVI